MEQRPEPRSLSEENRVQVRRNLRDTFTKTLLPVVGNASVTKIISVGCGVGLEAAPLLDLFPGSTYRGIDDSKHTVLIARGYNADIPQERAGFEEADAAEAESYSHGPYDLVVVRSPQVGAQKGLHPVWEKIFQESSRAISQEGFLYVAAASDVELKVVEEYIRDNGLEIKSEVRDANTYGSSPLANSFPDIDVVIAQKV